MLLTPLSSFSSPLTRAPRSTPLSAPGSSTSMTSSTQNTPNYLPVPRLPDRNASAHSALPCKKWPISGPMLLTAPATRFAPCFLLRLISLLDISQPLPAPPPSPASSLASSSPSSTTCSRSSTCIPRLPSFTRMLSSDQNWPQDTHPLPPVGVMVRGEYRHDPIPVRHDGHVHNYNDPFSQSLMHSQNQEPQCPYPILGDTNPFQPSETLINFSCAYSRETSVTTPDPSSPVSTTSSCLKGSPTAPGHHGMPSSSSSRCLCSLAMSSPKANVLPASLTLGELPAAGNLNMSNDLRVPILPAHLQSRWSASTTDCPPPSTAELTLSDCLGIRSRPEEKKDKGSKKTNNCTRFLDFISCISSGLDSPASTAPSSQTGDNVKTDSADDSGTQDRVKKARKSPSTKSSLTSLKASLSLPWRSSSSQRGSIEDVPSLPTSPTLTAPPTSTETTVPLEVVPSTPKCSLSKVPSEGNLLNPSLPPASQSASTVQLSIHPTANQAITVPNFIFRKPKSREIASMPGSKETTTPSGNSVGGNIYPPSPTTLCPNITPAHVSAEPPFHAVPKVPRSTSSIKKRPTRSLPSLPPPPSGPVPRTPTSVNGVRDETIKGFGKGSDFAMTSKFMLCKRLLSTETVP